MARAKSFASTRPRLPLSNSRIGDLACPYRFEQLHIKKFKEPKSSPLIVGGAVHDFAERYQKHLAEKGVETDITTATRFASEVAGQIPAEFIESSDEAERLMLQWAENHLARLDTYQEAELELAFREDWSKCGWMDPAVFFRAKIDRVDLAEDGVIEITDYSTSWKIGDQKKLQLEIYCMAVALAMKGDMEVTEYRVFTEFVRQNYRRGPEVYAPGVVELTQKRLLQVSDQVEALRDRGVFPAQPSSLCAWCRIPNCPALTNEARDPSSIAGRLLLLEREAKRLEEQLKAHAAAAGPVSVGDLSYGYWPTETKKIDREKWVAAGGSAEALNVNLVSARKFMKGRPDLQALVEIKSGSRWGARKEGVVNED